MRHLLLGILVFCTVSTMAQTRYQLRQRAWSAGIVFGTTNYSGDLAAKNVQVSETHLGYGAFARYFFSTRFAMKVQLLAGAISGDDAHAKDPDVKMRSFRFGADILELAAIGEWYPLGLYRYSDVGVHRFFVAPYLYLGFGAAFTGSKVEYYGALADFDRVTATPLPEFAERQRFILAPAGLGVRTRLNETIMLGLEAGARPVFSDKLDGVSLNGNPKKKDWYYFGGASVAFALSRSSKRI